MKIQTKFYGEVEAETTQCIEFVKPLLGFENQTQFAVLPALEGLSPFSMMQSLEDINLAFYVIDPWVVDVDYEFELTPEQIEKLEVSTSEDLKVLTLVTIDRDIEKMTTSLVAPIIVNMKNQKAMQIVLHQSAYTTKHLILTPKAC